MPISAARWNTVSRPATTRRTQGPGYRLHDVDLVEYVARDVLRGCPVVSRVVADQCSDVAPAVTSASTRWLPMKPPAPVTRTRFPCQAVTSREVCSVGSRRRAHGGGLTDLEPPLAIRRGAVAQTIRDVAAQPRKCARDKAERLRRCLAAEFQPRAHDCAHERQFASRRRRGARLACHRWTRELRTSGSIS